MPEGSCEVLGPYPLTPAKLTCELPKPLQPHVTDSVPLPPLCAMKQNCRGLSLAVGPHTQTLPLLSRPLWLQGVPWDVKIVYTRREAKSKRVHLFKSAYPLIQVMVLGRGDRLRQN